MSVTNEIYFIIFYFLFYLYMCPKLRKHTQIQKYIFSIHWSSLPITALSVKLEFFFFSRSIFQKTCFAGRGLTICIRVSNQKITYLFASSAMNDIWIGERNGMQNRWNNLQFHPCYLMMYGIWNGKEMRCETAGIISNSIHVTLKKPSDQEK